MHLLESLMGPSWRSTTLGVLSILTGLALFLVGWGTDEGTLKVMGLGLIPTGILGLVTRDNSASVVAHDESLAKIAAAETSQQHAHVQNVEKIDTLTEQVAAVPAVVAQTVKQEVPTAVAQVINESDRQRYRQR